MGNISSVSTSLIGSVLTQCIYKRRADGQSRQLIDINMDSINSMDNDVEEIIYDITGTN